MRRRSIRLVAAVAALSAAAGCFGPAKAPTTPRASETVTRLGGKGRVPMKAQAAAGTAQGSFMTTVRAMAEEPPQSFGQAGGKYVDATGNLEAIIAPGSLDRDAKIRIIPADTAGMPSDEDQVPGMAFAIDFAGARLKPGGSITVTTPADPRLLTDAKALDPGFSAQKYGMRQDLDGTWLLTMKVKGPAPSREPARGPVGEYDLVETYADPAFLAAWPTADEVAKGAADARKLTWFGLLQAGTLAPVTTGDPYVDGLPPMPANRKAELAPIAVVKFGKKQRDQAIKESRAATLKAGGEFFTCTFKHLGCKNEVYAAIDDIILYNKIVNANRLPPADQIARAKAYDDGVCKPKPKGGATPEPEPVTAVISAHVTYVSDDPAVNGTNALPGDRVQFAIQTEPDGATETEVGAGGLAPCPEEFPEGEVVSLVPYTFTPVHAVGSPAVAAVRAGMPPVECITPKYSPKITLKFTTFAAVQGTLTLNAKLDGRAVDIPVPMDVPAAGGQATFFQIVPDDADHRFEVQGGLITTSAGASTAFGVSPQVTALAAIHRNGVYELPIQIVPIGAK